MLSVLILIRNSARSAENLLRSVIRTFQQLGLPQVEFIVVDDDSHPDQNIHRMLADFKSLVKGKDKVVQMLFRKHQHYTRAMAYGLSAAQGDQVLFISHDMLITPSYVKTLLAVAATDRSLGVVRGRSPYVDCFPHHQVSPPVTPRSLEDVESFAEFVSEHHGLEYVEDRLLTGDSMLISRPLLDKIGVFDSRYVGYFGDIDFGLRAQRNGFKMVCAKGAWLWHEGAAAYKDDAFRSGRELSKVQEDRMIVVGRAYEAFREKWDLSMPPTYTGSDFLPLEKLRDKVIVGVAEFEASRTPSADMCTLVL